MRCMQQFEDVISAKTKYCFKDFVTFELYYQRTGKLLYASVHCDFAENMIQIFIFS